jgi:hypothetical protein
MRSPGPLEAVVPKEKKVITDRVELHLSGLIGRTSHPENWIFL